MSGVMNIPVAKGDADARLDRWFKRHYPQLRHGRLEKLLRTGQIRVDGGRVRQLAPVQRDVSRIVRAPAIAIA